MQILISALLLALISFAWGHSKAKTEYVPYPVYANLQDFTVAEDSKTMSVYAKEGRGIMVISKVVGRLHESKSQPGLYEEKEKGNLTMEKGQEYLIGWEVPLEEKEAGMIKMPEIGCGGE